MLSPSIRLFSRQKSSPLLIRTFATSGSRIKTRSDSTFLRTLRPDHIVESGQAIVDLSGLTPQKYYSALRTPALAEPMQNRSTTYHTDATVQNWQENASPFQPTREGSSTTAPASLFWPEVFAFDCATVQQHLSQAAI